MQIHHDLSVTNGTSHLIHEGACLVCGATVPVLPTADDSGERLRALGWHSWLSHMSHSPRRHLSLLRLCPQCASDPMFVATRILENHGADQMEEWIRSMELELG